MGSSRQSTIFGSVSSKVDRVSVTRSMLRAQDASGFRSISQFIVGEGRAVSDRVGRPGIAVEIHQGQQQPGIDAAAQEQADRHIADELALHCLLVNGEQLFPGFAGRLWRCKGSGLESVPPAHLRCAVLDGQFGSRGEFADSLDDRVRRGSVTIAQEEIQRSRVDLGTAWHRRRERRAFPSRNTGDPHRSGSRSA